MGLARVGPVAIAWDGHLNPSFRWTSAVDPAGLRDAEISGYFDWQVAEQLSELVANVDAAPTIGGRKGPLVPIWADDSKLQQFVGLYILESFELEADQPSSLSDAPVAGRLSACYVDLTVREYVLTHTAVPKGNNFSLTAKSTVVSPFRPSDDAGEEFLAPPGGTFATREYDPTSVYDPASPTPDDPAAIGLYVGTVTDDDDDIASVVYPVFALSHDEPLWLSEQGGNVRAYDRTATRHVYGPHPFLESTDLQVENGLLRFWVGNRGLVPFLNVEAFRSGTWRQVGTVQLATSSVLTGARLTTITPEEAVVALSVQDQGTVLVSLRRGERMLRVQHGTGSVTIGRTVRWYGTPPASLDSPTSGTGKFGNGLASGFAEFTWPTSLPNDEWSFAGWWLPTAATASQGTSGLLGIMDDDTQVGSVYWDADDDKLKFELDGTTVQTSALTFSASTPVFFSARFSTVDGMALSVLVTGGALEHVANASQLDPGATAYDSFVIGANDTGAPDWEDPGDNWEEGTGFWEGWQLSAGVIDNLMLFSDRLSDAEAAALAAAATALAGLPDPLGRLVWYAPFDPAPAPMAGALASGLVADSAADANGLTRAVAALNAGAVAAGVGLGAVGSAVALAAIVATSGTSDTAADQHGQFAADSSQEVRVR